MIFIFLIAAGLILSFAVSIAVIGNILNKKKKSNNDFAELNDYTSGVVVSDSKKK